MVFIARDHANLKAVEFCKRVVSVDSDCITPYLDWLIVEIRISR
jgi:hypothetical protein